MELKLSQLASHLEGSPAPVYLLAGEEPLQIQESVVQIQARARACGFCQRQVLHADSSFDWSALTEQSHNLSLFGDRKMLELHLPGARVGVSGAKALQHYCRHLPQDALLIINSGKLDKSALKSKWLEAVTQAGVLIRIWPLTGTELVRWLQARLRAENLPDDRRRAEYLAARVEGNMLAAAQEIEKMALLALDKNNPGQVWLSSQSRYTVFDLVDTILLGQRPKVVRILSQLQRESLAPGLVLWGLAELIRAVIFTGTQKPGRCGRVQNVFYYNKRNQLNRQAGKFDRRQLYMLLSQCGQLDQIIKGRASGDVWQSCADLALKLAR